MLHLYFRVFDCWPFSFRIEYVLGVIQPSFLHRVGDLSKGIIILSIYFVT